MISIPTKTFNAALKRVMEAIAVVSDLEARAEKAEAMIDKLIDAGNDLYMAGLMLYQTRAQLFVYLRGLRSIAHKFDTNLYLGYRAGENCLTITDDGLYLRDLVAIASPLGTVTVEGGYHEITGKQIYLSDEAIE